jgi:hypothetical protein
MFKVSNGDARCGIGYDSNLAVTRTIGRMQTAQATKRSEPPLFLPTAGDREVTRVIRLLLVQPGYRSRLDGSLQA